MALFTWFRTKRAYAVFIDVPNVENAGLNTQGVRYLIAWDKLVHVIKKKFHGMNMIRGGAFTRLFGFDPEVIDRWIVSATKRWQEQGFQLTAPWKKDIDSLIVSEMWSVADEAVLHNYTELNIVIVSGDHIFANTVRKLQEQYRDRLKIKLYVYAWHDSLSKDLIQTAGKSNVFPLETIRDLVRTKARNNEPAPS